AMDDPRGAYVAVVEGVPGVHAISVADGSKVVPGGVVRSAPQALVVVGRQAGAVGVAEELLRPSREQRLQVSHEAVLVGVAPRRPGPRLDADLNADSAGR